MEFEARVSDALSTVLRDLATHSSPPSGFQVRRIQGTLYVALGEDVDGGDPLFDNGAGETERLLAVADAVQTLVSNNAGDEVWPVCPLHGFGLHPTLVGFDAVWVCRPEHHSVASIGTLSA